MKVRYITRLSQIEQLSDAERKELEPVADRFAFRLNDYYAGLINWGDPNDPLRRLVIPQVAELRDWGKLDASDEASYTPVRGCQHKYTDTALLLVNEVCGAYCRYCFRKRLFMNDNDEASLDYSPGLAYIAEHEEITNVLLTSGDPLILSTRRLEKIVSDVSAIPHVRIIRVGSKMLPFNPHRVLDDPTLHELIQQTVAAGTQVYIMNHFDHPREITNEAKRAIRILQSAGAQTVNQCPMVRGVNDQVATMASLFRELSFLGCPQYYVFQGRPVEGNQPFELPWSRDSTSSWRPHAMFPALPNVRVSQCPIGPARSRSSASMTPAYTCATTARTEKRISAECWLPGVTMKPTGWTSSRY
jgi:KamA family protein